MTGTARTAEIRAALLRLQFKRMRLRRMTPKQPPNTVQYAMEYRPAPEARQALPGVEFATQRW